MKKLNLGNINAGLNSLKAATDNAAQNGRFELIDTALIDFAAKNSYAADDNEESYKELAANIDEVGLLTPLGVHWTKVPCYVFETKSVRKAQLMLHQANASREYTPQRKLQLYEEYRELLEEMKEAGEIKGGMQEHLAKLMGVSERSVRYYKQMSEQLTTEEKDDVAEGRLDIKEARERAVERGRETGNIAGSGEKEEKSEKSEKPKQDKLEQAILKVLKLADKEDPEKVTALLNRYLRGYMG